MAAPAKTTKYEIWFALTFLRLAGIKNAHLKIYLILAIVAWKRSAKTDAKIWATPHAALARLKKVAGGASVLKTLRQFVAASNYEQQQQAVRFLTVLGLSAWDKDHFGIFDAPPLANGNIDVSGNKLFILWNKLLAMKHSIPQPQPAQPKPPPPYKPPKPKKRQPDDKVYLTPVPVYIQPYAAFDFYEERKRKQMEQAGVLG